MGWRDRGRPVSDKAAQWIQDSLAWLRAEFGDAALRGEVLRLDWAAAALEDVAVGDRLDPLAPLIATRMALDVSKLTLNVVPDAESLGMAGKAPGLTTTSGAAGTYNPHSGSPVVSISESQLDNPVSLIATIAHEFAHVRLLGEGRMQRDRPDMEQMTDLAVVFFGLGIFTANAAFDFQQSMRGWRQSELGYLGEAMLGFALAVYAGMRDETKPAWADDLDVNPHTYMRHSIKYLARTRDQTAPQSLGT